MKNLFFLAALGLAFAAGSRRARKRGPIDEICVEIKADTSQAVAALKELTEQAKACQVQVQVVGELVGNGTALSRAIRAADYRRAKCGGEGACQSEGQCDLSTVAHQADGTPRDHATADAA